MVLKSEDTQLLNGSQKETKKERATKARETSLDSKNSSKITPQPQLLLPSTRNCEERESNQSYTSIK